MDHNAHAIVSIQMEVKSEISCSKREVYCIKIPNSKTAQNRAR